MLEILFMFVYGMLTVVLGAFFVRMVVSWFNPESENTIYRTACFLTEIFCAPIRIFMEKNNILTDFPIDMAFMFGYFLVMILQFVLVAFI